MIDLLGAQINIWGVLLAVVSNIIVGMLWFGPLLGKQWMKAVNKKREELQSNPVDYVWTIVIAFLTAISIAFIVSYIPNENSILTGLQIGLIAWGAFAIPPLANRKIWEGMSKELFLINSSHILVSYLVMGLLIGWSLQW